MLIWLLVSVNSGVNRALMSVGYPSHNPNSSNLTVTLTLMTLLTLLTLTMLLWRLLSFSRAKLHNFESALRDL